MNSRWRKYIVAGKWSLGILCVCLCIQCSALEKNSRRDNPDGKLHTGAMEVCKAGSQEGLEDTFTCVLKDSGMRVIVASLPSARNTSVRVVYGVGTGDEGPGESGAAHLLEHLLYQGTKKFPAPEKALRRIGGNTNASTSLDATTYGTMFPAGDAAFQLVLDIEMDRMRNARIETLDLDAERSVVRKEHESSHGKKVHTVLRDIVYDAAFPKHGYGQAGRAIENLSDLDVSVIDDFYRRHYRPNNATIVVSGPFAAADVLGWVVQSANRNPPRRPALERDWPNTKEVRSATAPSHRVSRIVANYPGKQTAIGVFFRSFPATHPDFPALANLRDVLVSGPEARLHKLLVEPGLAKRVSAGVIPNRSDGGLFIVVDPAPEQDPKVVRQILLKSLRALGSGERPVSLKEAKRARLLATRAMSRLRATSMNVASRIARSVAHGDWRYAYALPKARAAVTVNDLNRVAQRFIAADRQTTVTVLPAENSPTAVASQAVGIDTSWIDRFAPLSSSATGGRAKIAAGSERSQDSNKTITRRFNECWSMDAAVDRRHTRGDVVGALLVRLAPPAVDVSNVDLLLHTLLPDLLFGPGAVEETGEIRIEQIAELGLHSLTVERVPGGWLRFDFSGGMKDVVAALKMLDARARTLRRDSQMVRRIAEQHIEAHAKKMKNPTMVVIDESMAFFDNVYDPGDLRRIAVPNLPASLEALTFADVQAFAQRTSLTKGHLVISGNVEMSEIEALMRTAMDSLSGRWPCKPGRTDKPRRIQALSKPALKKIRMSDASVASVLVVNATKHGLKDADLFAFEIAGKILNTRISDRLRRQGLAYHHAAMFAPRFGLSGESAAGVMSVAAATNPARVNRVAEIIGEELRTLRQRGVSVDEVTSAKNALVTLENHMGPLAYSVHLFTAAYVRGTTRQESMPQWLRQNATMRGRLTAADVNTALSGYLTDDAHITVMAGNLF